MLSTSLTNLCFNYYDISGMVKWKQLINGNYDIKSIMNLQICKKKQKTKKTMTVISELAMKVYQI